MPDTFFPTPIDETISTNIFDDTFPKALYEHLKFIDMCNGNLRKKKSGVHETLLNRRQ